MKHYKNFLVGFFVSLMIFPLFLVLFVIIIDPFSKFDLISLPGINTFKSQNINMARLFKAHQILKRKPQNIILGSSRVELGLDPDHPAWKKIPGSTYNAAMSGIGIFELNKMLQHSFYASNKINIALIGLDFIMFNAHREEVIFVTEVSDFDERRLLKSETDNPYKAFLCDLPYFIGTPALKLSGGTLLTQKKDPLTTFYYQNGQRSDEFMEEIIKKAGPRAMFSSQEWAYIRKIWRAGHKRRYCLRSPAAHNTLNTFRELVRFAYAHNINIRFFTTPIHARMILAIRQAGLWPQFEEWKREVTKIIYEEAKNFKAEPFVFWDFCGFFPVNEEQIPDEASRTPMKYYFEGSHFNRKVGDIITSYLIGNNVPHHNTFGKRLTPQNIESYLLQQRQNALRYIRNNPKEFQFVQNHVENELKDSNGSNCGYDTEAIETAITLLNRGDQQKAKVYLEKAVFLHNQEKKKYDEIGVPFREDKFWINLERAKKGQPIESPPKEWTDYQTVGQKRYEEKNFKDAIRYYSIALQLAPEAGKIALYYLRGITFMEEKEYKNAIQDFEAVLKTDPKNKTVLHLLKEISKKKIS